MVDGQQTCEPVRMTEALKVISLSDYNCDRLESGSPWWSGPFMSWKGRDFIKDREEEDSSSL